jgi:hypothetical protein
MTAVPDFYLKARSETAELLHYDLGCLTPEQSLRLDCAVALRLALDDLQGRIVRGESADVARMLTASEALARLLPPAVLATPPSDETHHQDPREVMFKIYMEMRERGEVPPEGHFQHRINELELENERLRAQIAGGLPDVPMAATVTSVAVGKRGKDGGSSTIDPTEVVPPGEYLGVPPMRGLDDPPKRSPVIDARPNPPAAGAPARPAWQDWLDAGGQGGARYDRWSNRNGA